MRRAWLAFLTFVHGPSLADRPHIDAPFHGLTPREYNDGKEYVLGVGWRHPNDPITADDWRAMQFERNLDYLAGLSHIRSR